jgi:type II secretory pathway pseudopilin PulG
MKKKDFSNLEIFIVSVIIVVLLGVAIPRFNVILIESRENHTKRNLRSLREAITKYSEENGNYPNSLKSSAFLERYIEKIPVTILKKKPKISNEIYRNFNDKGGWCYSSKDGVIIVNSLDKDSKGNDINLW